LEVGLLINFGAKSLEVKRLYNKKSKAYNPDNKQIRPEVQTVNKNKS
jgi:hypothetical protein